MPLIDDTLASLERATTRGSAVVMYSGGKDSRVCLDLAVRSCSSVVACYMHFLPGLECDQVMLDEARQRWGVEIIQLPHWGAPACLNSETYCYGLPLGESLPRINIADIWSLAMHQTGASSVIVGAKNSDSAWKRRTLSRSNRENVIYPIKSWALRDVIAYLRLRGIPHTAFPDGENPEVSLAEKSILRLADRWPDDFARLCEVFPFAEAVVWRRKFYGSQEGSSA